MARPNYTHITVECLGCPTAVLNDSSTIKAALLTAASVCNLHVVQDGLYQFRPQGLTGYVLLSESHISVHTWPEEHFALVDVLSCTTLNVDALINCLKNSLQPRTIDVKMDTRTRARAELHSALKGTKGNDSS